MIKKILLSIVFLAGLSGGAIAEIKKGDTLQLLSNLHPDSNRRIVYSMNYQLPTLMPVCTEVKVVAVNKKKMVFTWAGVEYTIKYDGHTRKAGISFDQVLSTYTRSV